MGPDEFNARVCEIDRAYDLELRRIACSSSTFERHPWLVHYDGRAEAALRKRDAAIEEIERLFYAA